MLKIAGFTGTQNGMTEAQKVTLKRLLSDLEVTHLHHGDCIGSDEQADDIAHALNIKTVIHPPSNSSKRAFCKNAMRVLPEKDYLPRNKDIVNSSNIMFATPGEFKQKLRSGTWSTVRFAVKQEKSLYVILPDGSLDETIPAK